MPQAHPDDEEYSFDDVFDDPEGPEPEYIVISDASPELEPGFTHDSASPADDFAPEAASYPDYEATPVDDFALDPAPEPVSPPVEIPDYLPGPDDAWPDEAPMPVVDDTWTPDNGDREVLAATPDDSSPDDGVEYVDLPSHALGQAGSEHASSEPIDIAPAVEEPNLAGGFPLAQAEVNAHLQTQLDREAEACAGDGTGGSAPL